MVTISVLKKIIRTGNYFSSQVDISVTTLWKEQQMIDKNNTFSFI